jgi:hypothetical protein
LDIGHTDSVPAKHGVFLLKSLDKVFTSAENSIKSLGLIERGSVRIEDKMMVLVVLADTGHVCYDWYVEILQDLGVTDARAFEYLWRSKSTGCDYDQLSSFNDRVDWFGE